MIPKYIKPSNLLEDQARAYARQHGIHQLDRHAAVGQGCKCGHCFCCAALKVVNQVKSSPKFIL